MAKNQPQIDIGQSGGAWVDNQDVYTPPTGKVIAAINVHTAATFTALTPANTVGSYHIGTSHVDTLAGNGTNSEAIVNSDSFPTGFWLYGRWSSMDLAGGAVIVYFADV